MPKGRQGQKRPADTVQAAIMGARMDMGFGPTGSDQVEQCVGVVTAVGNDVTAFETREQKRRCAQVLFLSGRQHQAHRQAILIDQGVDLGA